MGLPVSGDSLAFFTASWNFFSRTSEACFCASTDCRKMDSRRVSCSFMARAASSMSLNMRGFTAAVCAITERVSVSTLRRALQQGQVTSKVGGFFAILRIIPQKWPWRSALEFDGEDAENVQELPSQKKNGEQDDEHRHEFSKGQAATIGLEATASEAENIDGGKAKDDRPKNVVDIVTTVRMALEQQKRRDHWGVHEAVNGGDRELGAGNACNHSSC